VDVGNQKNSAVTVGSASGKLGRGRWIQSFEISCAPLTRPALLAKALAHQLDLSRIAGSGPHGIIRKPDVLAVLAKQTATVRSPIPLSPVLSVSSSSSGAIQSSSPPVDWFQQLRMAAVADGLVGSTADLSPDLSVPVHLRVDRARLSIAQLIERIRNHRPDNPLRLLSSLSDLEATTFRPSPSSVLALALVFDAAPSELIGLNPARYGLLGILSVSSLPMRPNTRAAPSPLDLLAPVPSSPQERTPVPVPLGIFRPIPSASSTGFSSVSSVPRSPLVDLVHVRPSADVFLAFQPNSSQMDSSDARRLLEQLVA
jgi:hypothetical protein